MIYWSADSIIPTILGNDKSKSKWANNINILVVIVWFRLFQFRSTILVNKECAWIQGRTSAAASNISDIDQHNEILKISLEVKQNDLLDLNISYSVNNIFSLYCFSLIFTKINHQVKLNFKISYIHVINLCVPWPLPFNDQSDLLIFPLWLAHRTFLMSPSWPKTTTTTTTFSRNTAGRDTFVAVTGSTWQL